MYDMRNVTKFEKLAELAPAAFGGFMRFHDATFEAGAISLKHKELIAVAVALTTQCPYCIDAHAANARNAGATEQELAEAADGGRVDPRRGRRGARHAHARVKAAGTRTNEKGQISHEHDDNGHDP